MKELEVVGQEGTHYIVSVNGKPQIVRTGDIVTLNNEKEADEALENIKTFGGRRLFREVIKNVSDYEKRNIPTSENITLVPRPKDWIHVEDAYEFERMERNIKGDET